MTNHCTELSKIHGHLDAAQEALAALEDELFEEDAKESEDSPEDAPPPDPTST